MSAKPPTTIATTASVVAPDVLADLEAVATAVAAGRPVDPDVARRVRQRADAARARGDARSAGTDVGVQLVREARGPLEEEQERELTLAQRDLVRRGDLRL